MGRFPARGSHRKCQQVRRTANSNRRHWMIQDAHLREHRGLIPIEMLVSHFARVKLHDAYQDELHLSSGGWHTRQHPIHSERVRKLHHRLFDHPIVAEDLRQRNDVDIWREVRQHVLGRERRYSGPTHPTRPGRNEEHGGILGPRSQGPSGFLRTNSA